MRVAPASSMSRGVSTAADAVALVAGDTLADGDGTGETLGAGAAQAPIAVPTSSSAAARPGRGMSVVETR